MFKVCQKFLRIRPQKMLEQKLTKVSENICRFS